MVLYALEQRWEVDRLTEDADIGRKLSFHSKADAPKTNYSLVRILVQRHNWAIFLRK